MAVTLDAHELLALGALTAAGLLGGSLHAVLPSVIEDQEEEPTVLAAHELQPGDTHPLLDPSGIDQSFTSYFFHPRAEEELPFAEAESDLGSDEEPAAPFLEQEWEYRDELFAVSAAAVVGSAWLWRQRAVGGISEEMQSGDLILISDGSHFPHPLWYEVLLVEQTSAPSDWLVYARRSDNTAFFWTVVRLLMGHFRLVGSRAAARHASAGILPLNVTWMRTIAGRWAPTLAEIDRVSREGRGILALAGVIPEASVYTSGTGVVFANAVDITVVPPGPAAPMPPPAGAPPAVGAAAPGAAAPAGAAVPPAAGV